MTTAALTHAAHPARWWAIGLLAASGALCASLPAPLAAQAVPPMEHGVIRGVVRDASGNALRGAEVSARGAPIATTGADGRFVLPAVPAGVVEVTVRRLGYRSRRADVRVPAGQAVVLDVHLAPAPTQLSAVTVIAPRREVFEARLSGYEERRERGTGHYIVRDELERLSSASFLDVLRRVPGVRISTMGGSMWTRVRLRGATCAPMVFVDGFPASAGEFDLSMVDPKSLEGVEVYNGMASIPADFVTSTSEGRCGVVALWSRPARAREPRSDGEARPPDQATEELSALLESGAVFGADQVDSAATLMLGSRLPEYPDSLLLAGVGGQVVVELVVSDTGTVEPGTVRIVSASHPELGAAVREAAPRLRFIPAVRGSMAVRQVVHLPFEFRPVATGEVRPSVPAPGARPGTGTPP